MLLATPLPACPLCRKDNDRDGFQTLKGFEKDYIVRCRYCGFTFSSLDPSESDYANVYDNYDYVGEDAARTELSIQNERDVVRALSVYKSTGKVLDIAAGSGRFLEHFAAQGFDCYATEFSVAMCGYLEAKGFTAYPGGLDPVGAPAGEFDVIVFTEVIEHTNRPLQALETISKLLRPGGAVYVTTPNFSSLERRVIGPAWGMLMWPEHITYWTPATLDRALRQVGLVKSSLETRNISPYRVIQALKQGRFARALRGVSEQSVSDKAQASVASSQKLSLAKNAINHGLRVTGLGSSIRAVYVKP